MSRTSLLRTFYLSHLSKPASDRPIYQAICRQRSRTMLELGIGIGERSARMIAAASRYTAVEEIRFTAVDLFESRSALDGPGVTLKLAHRRLVATGARIQLVPGDPHTGLFRCANSLGKVDLVVVSARLDPSSLARAWQYVPRLLDKESRVFRETLLPGGRMETQELSQDEVQDLAAAAASKRRAA